VKLRGVRRRQGAEEEVFYFEQRNSFFTSLSFPNSIKILDTFELRRCPLALMVIFTKSCLWCVSSAALTLRYPRGRPCRTRIPPQHPQSSWLITTCWHHDPCIRPSFLVSRPRRPISHSLTSLHSLPYIQITRLGQPVPVDQRPQLTCSRHTGTHAHALKHAHVLITSIIMHAMSMYSWALDHSAASIGASGSAWTTWR
jgi:hypothetical protein